MDHSHIELKGSQIASIIATDSAIGIVFSRALIIKRMTGSAERTRWWQAGTLVLEGVAAHSGLPPGPCHCAGGEIDENIYSYRDMIPIPFSSRGRIRCLLLLEGQDQPLVVEAGAVRLELDGVPKYIEHLRA